jgi:hypothetical protein
MAISPKEAGSIVEEKHRLTTDELDAADKLEEQIDSLVRSIYTGKSATVSLQRPAPRITNEVRRRYEKAGWNFTTTDDDNKRQAGFSITLTPKVVTPEG